MFDNALTARTTEHIKSIKFVANASKNTKNDQAILSCLETLMRINTRILKHTHKEIGILNLLEYQIPLKTDRDYKHTVLSYLLYLKLD